jgi:hypothetical protein
MLDHQTLGRENAKQLSTRLPKRRPRRLWANPLVGSKSINPLLRLSYSDSSFKLLEEYLDPSIK